MVSKTVKSGFIVGLSVVAVVVINVIRDIVGIVVVNVVKTVKIGVVVMVL